MLGVLLIGLGGIAGFWGGGVLFDFINLRVRINNNVQGLPMVVWIASGAVAAGMTVAFILVRGLFRRDG
jgi:hypothetical protein